MAAWSATEGAGVEVRVDAKLIRTARERRAWSQEHLAKVAGIGLRTLQRIEATGIASYASVQALAAVLEMAAQDLHEAGPARNATGVLPTAIPASDLSAPPARPAPGGKPRRARGPFAVTAGGIAASLLALLSAFVAHDVTAQKVRLDVDVAIAKYARAQQTTQERQTTLTANVKADSTLLVFDDAGCILVTIKPGIRADGKVLLATKIFELAAGVEPLKFDVEHSAPLSTPAILVADRATGEIRLGDGQRRIRIRIKPSVLR